MLGHSDVVYKDKGLDNECGLTFNEIALEDLLGSLLRFLSLSHSINDTFSRRTSIIVVLHNNFRVLKHVVSNYSLTVCNRFVLIFGLNHGLSDSLLD